MLVFAHLLFPFILDEKRGEEGALLVMTAQPLQHVRFIYAHRGTPIYSIMEL